MDISRRQALQKLSGVLGGALSAPVLGAIMSGCRAEAAPTGWTPQALTPDNVDMLGTVVDLIIPATDTPGAKEVGVPVFIDRVLNNWAKAEDRARFQMGLAGLDDQMQEANGVAFRDATPEQQDVLLSRLDQEAIRARTQEVEPLPFFATLKEWTLVGYYTSEVGATQELQWLPIPGRYDADVPLEEVGRTWA